jgi:hypothetical protein
MEMSRAIRLEIAQTRRAERVAHPGAHRQAMGPGHTPELTELGLVEQHLQSLGHPSRICDSYR